MNGVPKISKGLTMCDTIETDCDNCGEFRDCDYIRDPYLADVDNDSSDETNPERWMCQECADIKRDDI